MFMVVDTVTGEYRALVNRNAHHEHGMCQPLGDLADEAIDGMVVGGIGRNALTRLRRAGIEVYRSEHDTVGETIAALEAGSLLAVALEHACGGHHGHGPGES
jgi:predicted Fe-Mo cluster-binding NifX family protein